MFGYVYIGLLWFHINNGFFLYFLSFWDILYYFGSICDDVGSDRVWRGVVVWVSLFWFFWLWSFTLGFFWRILNFFGSLMEPSLSIIKKTVKKLISDQIWWIFMIFRNFFFLGFEPGIFIEKFSKRIELRWFRTKIRPKSMDKWTNIFKYFFLFQKWIFD